MTTPEGSQSPREILFWRALFAVLGIAVLVFSIALIFFWEPTTTVLEETIPAGRAAGLTASKRTTTTAPVSDTLSASVLGFTLLLLLVAAYYNRITKITGPGGFGAELSNEEKDSSARIVGAKASAGAEIKDLATQGPAAPEKADAAASDLAVTSATATSTVQDAARQLLTLSRASPEQCRTLASRLEVPAPVVEDSVIRHRTTPELWEALAEHVLRGR